MTILRSFRLAHTLLSTAPRSTQLGTVARILPVLAASLALAVGADPAQASIPFSPTASDTLRVTLSAPEGGTVAEGATGHFEVSVAGSTADGAVTIRYSVSGTAAAGEDYATLSSEATVAQGESVARIALEAFEDGILDRGETVVLALTGATGPGTVVVDPTAATATIADDGSVTVSLTAVPDTISEGSAWTSTVTMSTPVADRVSVRWRTTDGTALAGRDYTAADEVVSFQPGETLKRISVQTLEDDNAEAVEVFYVSLDPPSISASAATLGAMAVNGDARSAFIECSVRFPQRGPIVFRPNEPVSAGRLVGTVAAETSGIAEYFVTGGDNKFTINLSGQIWTKAALDRDELYELEVTVVDADCDAKASVDVTVKVNRKPEAEAGDDAEVREGDAVTLNGSGTDPDNDRLTYNWTGDLALTNPNTQTPRFTAPDVTTSTPYKFTLTVADPRGLSGTDSVTITVKPNRAPTAEGEITDRRVGVGESGSVNVLSKFDDPDGDPLTYAVESSKPTVVGVSVDGSVVTYNGLEEGIATVTVTARDRGDLSATQSFDVEVEGNDPPIANAGDPQTVAPGSLVQLDGSGSSDPDPGDSIDKWQWEQKKGPDVALSGADTESPSFTAPVPSDTTILVFELLVTDKGGLVSDPDSVTITVLPNRPPNVTVEASPNPAEEGETVSLTGTADDPENDPVTYLWTQVSGSPQVTIKNATKLSASFTAPSVTNDTDLTFQLTATDEHGASGSADTTVTVVRRSGTARHRSRSRRLRIRPGKERRCR